MVQRLSDWSLCITICKFDYYTVYSVYQIINKGRKGNKQAYTGLAMPPCPAPLRSRHSHLSLVHIYVPELTLLCGQGWYPSVPPFVLWAKVMGRAIWGTSVNPRLTTFHNFMVFKIDNHITLLTHSKSSRTYYKHQSVSSVRLGAVDICEYPVNFQWPMQVLTHSFIWHLLC